MKISWPLWKENTITVVMKKEQKRSMYMWIKSWKCRCSQQSDPILLTNILYSLEYKSERNWKGITIHGGGSSAVWKENSFISLVFAAASASHLQFSLGFSFIIFFIWVFLMEKLIYVWNFSWLLAYHRNEKSS